MCVLNNKYPMTMMLASELSYRSKTVKTWQTLLTKDWCRCPAYLHKPEHQRKIQTKWTKASNCESIKRCFSVLQVWSVRCRLCLLHESTPIHQRVEEHKQSTIRNHVKDEHGNDSETIGTSSRFSKNVRVILAVWFLNKWGKFLKKLLCCVGGEYDKIIWFYQLGW